MIFTKKIKWIVPFPSMVFGSLAGIGIAQYSPVLGGSLNHIARPFSPARTELVPSHMILCAVLAGLIGFFLTLAIEKIVSE